MANERIKRDKTHSLSRAWEKSFKKSGKAKDRRLNRKLERDYEQPRNIRQTQS
jgi:hypothetical protein